MSASASSSGSVAIDQPIRSSVDTIRNLFIVRVTKDLSLSRAKTRLCTFIQSPKASTIESAPLDMSEVVVDPSAHKGAVMFIQRHQMYPSVRLAPEPSQTTPRASWHRYLSPSSKLVRLGCEPNDGKPTTTWGCYWIRWQVQKLTHKQSSSCCSLKSAMC